MNTKNPITCSVCHKRRSLHPRKPWWIICPCDDKFGIYAWKLLGALLTIGNYKYEFVHDSCLMKRVQCGIVSMKKKLAESR